MNQAASHEPMKQSASTFAMTCRRLRGREALVVVTLVGLFWIFAPSVARRWASIDFPADYRTPYEVSEDYWRYREFVRSVVRQDQILMVGDSVIWGEYVPADQALSAALNRELSVPKFANGGINGLHPLAIHGLLHHYAQPLQGQRVLLHCNLLWMTSAERDLSGNDDSSFNHPRLIPQFLRSLTSYDADLADRLSVFVEQHVPMRQWARHLWQTYLDGQDLPRWTREHPYEWPKNQMLGINARDTRQTGANWLQRAIPQQAYDWRTLESSQQWAAFERTIAHLQSRGNKVFVLVGPFNSHLLTDENRAQWLALRNEISTALANADVGHFVPDPLPSDEYADASHPLAAGYQRIADSLLNDPGFQAWMGNAR
jgi:hypothetical protein